MIRDALKVDVELDGSAVETRDSRCVGVDQPLAAGFAFGGLLDDIEAGKSLKTQALQRTTTNGV